MKLKLRDLELVRQDPSILITGGQPAYHYRGQSKRRTLQLATYEFHRQGGDLQWAAEHFRAMYKRNFKREDRLTELERDLARYAAAYQRYQQLGYEQFQSRLHAKIPVDTALQLVGEIPRLDIAPTGYAAWLFCETFWTWKDELRMPLLQAYVAEQMGAPWGEVTIGVYCFDTGAHDRECFSDTEIGDAREEVHALANFIAPSAA